AVAEDGRLTDVTRDCKFSTPDAVIAISADGECAPRADGQTEASVSYQGRSATVKVTARDTGTASQPSFLNHVEPILTRLGCNQGACHGKGSGQNGFRLSLRGYAPELDHPWITREYDGRRMDPAIPENSLLLLKPLGVAPHEGGKVLMPAS